MRFVALFCASLTFSNLTYAGCKVTETKDPFTGSSTSTIRNSLGVFTSDGKKVTFTYGMSQNGSVQFAIQAGTLLEFALEDGSMVSMPVLAESQPVFKVWADQYSGGNYTVWAVAFEPTPADIQHLAASYMVGMRLPVVDPAAPNPAIEVKKPIAKILQREMACVLTKLYPA